MTDMVTSREGLRYALGTRLEIALEQDQFVELEKTNSSLYAVLRPEEKGLTELKIKMLDFN